MKWDVFISHASEDKEKFVKPLAVLLKEFGVKVWYDDFTLEVGDSLSRSIDKGLANSKYGIVVISSSFMSKDWPEYELRGLVSKEIGRDKVILPIWHEVEIEDILKYSPTLADKVALDTSNLSYKDIAISIIKVVRPDIYENIYRTQTLEEIRRKAEFKEVEVSKFNISREFRHEKLLSSQLVRIKIIQKALEEVFPVTFEITVDNFKRDANPERELMIWERIVASYLEYTSNRILSTDQKKEIFNILLIASTQQKMDLHLLNLKYIDSEEATKVANLFFTVVPGIPSYETGIFATVIENSKVNS